MGLEADGRRVLREGKDHKVDVEIFRSKVAKVKDHLDGYDIQSLPKI